MPVFNHDAVSQPDTRIRLETIEEHVAGDSIIFGPWTVREGETARDISDDELRWYLFETEYDRDPAEAILSHDDPGLTLGEPKDMQFENGHWQVFVSEGVTADLRGTYYQVAVVDPTDSSRQSWIGKINII